jgi:hypothetical protein
MKSARRSKLLQRITLCFSALILAVTPLLLDRTFAHAAAVTSRKDTLSTSAPATLANHTIQFVTPTGVAGASTTVTLTFGAGFTTVSTIAFGDVDVLYDTDGTCTTFSTQISLLASAGATDWGVGSSGQVVTLTHSTAGANQSIPAGRCVKVLIGTNAVNGTTGTNRITNPAKVAAAGTADVTSIAIGGSFGDTGTLLVATDDQVSVSATITESLSFAVSGMSGATCQTSVDSGTPTQVATTATTVPFGTISVPNTFYAGCQDLTVSTNASNGYIVTSEENTSLKTGSLLIPDTSCDSACTHDTTTSGTAWATATNSGLGYWCQNSTNTPCNSNLNANTKYKRLACTGTAVTQCTPGGGQVAQTILTQAGPANADVGRIHYKLAVSALQAAGSYTNTLTYIATPSF